MSVTEPSEIMASAVFETSSSATILSGSPAAMKFIAVWVAMLPHCSWPAASAALMSASVVKLTISTLSRPGLLEQVLLGRDVPLAVAEPGLDAHLDGAGFR